jgi:hypothetical protein
VKREVNEMDRLKKAPYAILGTGDWAMEKSAQWFGKAQTWGRKARRTDVGDVYSGLTGRGESLVKRIQRSKTAKRAAEGTRQASRQVKGAVTSIRKAVGIEEERQRKTSSRKAG